MNLNGARLAAVLLLAGGAAAALDQPLAINFQGKLLNPTTNVPATGTAQLTFKIFNAASGGAALWTEGPDGVTVTNGVFFLTVGTNTALTRDLFLGASAYLEVTVNSVNGVADGTAMTPRQRLTMTPQAFTANQSSDQNDVRLIAGSLYSTFTSAGNLAVPYGLVAASATVTGGLTASSGTFQASGASQFSLMTSSGVQSNAGTVDVNGEGGVANSYGLWTGSAAVTGSDVSVGGSSFTVSGGSAAVAYSLTAKQFVASSSMTASSFFGNGAHLTRLTALNNVWVYTNTSGTTWSYAAAVAAGVTSIYVEAIGGGGGGGSSTAGNNKSNCGGGGGGGGYAAAALVLGTDVTGDQTATAGAGGAGGLATGLNAGNNGSASSFGSLVVAGFGSGGGAPATSGTSIVSSAGGAGGNGTTGDVLLSAGDGARSVRWSGTHCMGGQGGGAVRGSGVSIGGWVGANNTTSAGNAGNSYGGGGSGSASAGATSSAGGDGAAGVVIVKEYR